LGRNVWQTEHPVAAMRGIRAIVHENFTPKEAEDLYNQIILGKA
jgi:putative autoinducer-2 (AI-2) aldolase